MQTGKDLIRRTECKECLSERRHAIGKRNTFERHGITQEQFDEMHRNQGGRCAICGTDNPFGPHDRYQQRRKRRVFSIDHCHATGKVRGLLCARCNLAIGNFGDDTERMRAAIAYLERHRQNGGDNATIPLAE